ncbi:phosphatase PAP2 family protein [Corynebacterium choanae]|nr:phosphatase PAP2 family protein [Corynebacterium choanae]
MDRPGVLPVARGMSHFGEHAVGWLALCALGAVADSKRRQCWLGSAGLVLASHASSVVLKRIVRRRRPHDPQVRVGVATPSKLSFPSSHATSSTTALLCLAALTGQQSLLVGIPLMMASRMVVGVHYPSDVTAGALIGGMWALGVKRFTCPAG